MIGHPGKEFDEVHEGDAEESGPSWRRTIPNRSSARMPYSELTARGEVKVEWIVLARRATGIDVARRYQFRMDGSIGLSIRNSSRRARCGHDHGIDCLAVGVHGPARAWRVWDAGGPGTRLTQPVESPARYTVHELGAQGPRWVLARTERVARGGERSVCPAQGSVRNGFGVARPK
jgi:hypothetical protein